MSGTSIGVVVVHDDEHTARAVGETLESAGDLFVAASSIDGARPGCVVVAGGEQLSGLAPSQFPLVALVDGDAIRAARAAIGAGAREIIAWPSEASRLPGAVRRAAVGARAGGEARGRVVAVAGARGGAGTSVLVALLASRFDGSIVVDLEGGQRMFAGSEVVAAALPEDATPDELGAVLTPHVRDSRCLHLARDLPTAARALAAVTVVDAGRAPGTRAAFGSADVRVLVVPNDVASVQAATALKGVSPLIVVRRARRDGVALKDIAAAVGSQPVAVLPNDRALARAVDLGKIPSRPTRSARAVARLARALEVTS